MPNFRLIKLFAAFSFLLIANIVYAQSITINLEDGKSVSFSFSEKPVLTHHDNLVVIHTNSTSAEYPISNIISLTKQVLTASIGTIAEKEIIRRNDNITFKGFSPSDDVGIYTEDGCKVFYYVIQEDGNLNIEVSHLPSGIYIVKVGSDAFKIIKK